MMLVKSGSGVDGWKAIIWYSPHGMRKRLLGEDLVCFHIWYKYMNANNFIKKQAKNMKILTL